MKTPVQRLVGLFAAFFGVFCLAVLALSLFGGNAFSFLLERSRAYTPPQFLTWLSLASGLSTAAVFCIIPFYFFRIVRRRSDVPFGWVVLCVAGFLFLCGASSLISLITIFSHGAIVIWSLVLSRLATALLSVATLLTLRALLPRILEIPTHEEWLAVNNDLLRVEAAAEAKDKLLAIAGHELRTPLAPLLATVTDLEEQVRCYDNPVIQECLDTLRKNIGREAHLVNNLLDRLELPGAEAPTPAPPLAPTPQNHSAPQRLLLLEDHADTLRTFARILRRKGFAVQEASTIAEARAAARPGDLLLSDIGLPDGDGRDLMRELHGRGIPGIAITGFGTAKDRDEYRRAGFAESLIKPIDFGELMNAIGRVTGGA